MDDLISELPHQPPMRLVERVVELVPGRRARATRRAQASDWYFDGHFPNDPVIPAIALLELLAQTGGLAVACDAGHQPKSLRLAALSDFKFPASAGPGALLDATADVVGRMGRLIKITGTVTADGRLVASGSLTLADVSTPSAP
jgi:3-hydroxymyristoyl/3-hydroxydecanoyl-(acyl carrier protein) dehydratase